MLMSSTVRDDVLVSFIVPVYKVEIGLLRRCLKSICRQTYSRIEILVVQDGPGDRYDSLINEINAEDSRLLFYKIDHSGVSGARNYALDRARGDYVTFVDSDDVVSEGFVRESLQIALKYNAQLVCGELCKTADPSNTVLPDGENRIKLLSSPSTISLLSEEILSGCPIDGHEDIWMSVQGPVSKLYSSSIIDGLRFDESLSIGEDVHFNVRALSRCERAVITNRIWYLYFQREGSLCHSGSIDKWTENIVQYMNMSGEEFEPRAVKARVDRLVTDMLYDSCSRHEYKNAIKRVKSLELDGYFSSQTISRYQYPAHRRLIYSLLDKGRYIPLFMVVHLISWVSIFKRLVNHE